MSIAPGNTLTGVNFNQNVISAVVSKLDTERNDRMFQDLFAKGKKLMVSEGNKVAWEKRTFSRGLSPAAQEMSRAPTRSRVGEMLEVADSILTKQSRTIPWTRLMKSDGSMRGDSELRDIIRTELKDMTAEVGRTVEYYLSGLCTGSVAVNSTTVPGSDVNRTFAFPVRTLTASASWATAGTKILSSELKLIQDDFETDVGLSPGIFISNNAVHANLIANTEVQAFAGGNADLARYFVEAKNGAPKPVQGLKLGGIEWWSNPHGYKLTSGGSLTKWIADERAIILPEEEAFEDVFGFADLPIPVPQGPRYGSAGDGFKAKTGLVAWAEFHGNPQSIELHVQRRFAGVLTFAEAVLYFDTTP